MAMPIPRTVGRVEDCTCSGGRELHEVDCAIHSMPYEQARAAIDAAEQRTRDYAEQLHRERLFTR